MRHPWVARYITLARVVLLAAVMTTARTAAAQLSTSISGFFRAAPRSLPALGERATLALLALLVLSPLPCLVAARWNYSLSLLIFIAPVAAALRDLHVRGQLRRVRGVLGVTTVFLSMMGVLLNLAFADDFFVYANPNATLGLSVPAFDVGSVDTAHPIPLEEFAFYGMGFLAILVGYVWVDRVLMPRRHQVKRVPGTTGSEVIGVPLLLVGAAWLLQRKLQPSAAFPSYFAYLALVPLPVTLFAWPRVRWLVNWPALAFIAVALLAVSVTWEVSLAVPNGWWGYQREAMIGVLIHPWSDLPLEAVLVWLLTPFTTIFVFEALNQRLNQEHA